MHRKALLLPALLLGILMDVAGLVIYAEITRTDGAPSIGLLAGALGVFALALVLTVLVFRVRTSTFDLSPDQFRLAWIGALFLGMAGFPAAVAML